MNAGIGGSSWQERVTNGRLKAGILAKMQKSGNQKDLWFVRGCQGGPMRDSWDQGKQGGSLYPSLLKSPTHSPPGKRSLQERRPQRLFFTLVGEETRFTAEHQGSKTVFGRQCELSHLVPKICHTAVTVISHHRRPWQNKKTKLSEHLGVNEVYGRSALPFSNYSNYRVLTASHNCQRSVLFKSSLLCPDTSFKRYILGVKLPLSGNAYHLFQNRIVLYFLLYLCDPLKPYL